MSDYINENLLGASPYKKQQDEAKETCKQMGKNRTS